MAAKKSNFLSAFGKSFQIFKVIVDALLDIGGTDEDMARILTNEDLRKDIAQRILEARQPKQLSKLDEAVTRLRRQKEELEAPAKEFAYRVSLAIEEFITFIRSKEGKKSLQLLRLTDRAITVVTQGVPRTERSYPETRYHRIYSYGLDLVTLPHGSFRDHDLTVTNHSDLRPQKYNFEDVTALVIMIQEFCKDTFVEEGGVVRQVKASTPEDFVPHIKKEIKKIASL